MEALFLMKNNLIFHFTPKPKFGAKNPKNKNLLCYGKDLRGTDALSKINLEWLIVAYQNTAEKSLFLIHFSQNWQGKRNYKNKLKKDGVHQKFETVGKMI